MDRCKNEPLEAVNETTKEPYEKPQLQVYGPLRELTSNIGMAGMTDPPPHSPPSSNATV